MTVSDKRNSIFVFGLIFSIQYVFYVTDMLPSSIISDNIFRENIVVYIFFPVRPDYFTSLGACNTRTATISLVHSQRAYYAV